MAEDPKPSRIDLGKAFLERQKVLSSELELPLAFTKHPTTIGDGSEANWERMLRTFLPARYMVGRVFALDAEGNSSEQIDLAIYDRQYSPLWFETAGNRFIPVESIYAALEVKQGITKASLGYAADKVRTVRQLKRTSGLIVDYAGVQDGAKLSDRPIIGGILALNSGWKDGVCGTTGRKHIEALTGDRRLDVGIALTDAAFDFVPEGSNRMLKPGLKFSTPGTQLIYFALHLFRRLQSIGTALAVDLNAYEQAIENINVSVYPDIDEPE